MLTPKEIKRFKNVSIEEVDASSLVEIRSVTIDPTQSQLKRIESILSQTHNPYCYLCNDTKVQVRHVGKERDLTQCHISYFSSMDKQSQLHELSTQLDLFYRIQYLNSERRRVYWAEYEKKVE